MKGNIMKESCKYEDTTEWNPENIGILEVLVGDYILKYRNYYNKMNLSMG